MADRDNVGIVRKDFEGHRVHIFAGIIFGELELYEICVLQWFPVHWIGIMCHEPSDDILMVEYETISGADRRVKRLETEGAKGEGQSLERCVCAMALLDA